MKNRVPFLLTALGLVSVYSAIAWFSKPLPKGVVAIVDKVDGEKAAILLSDTYLIDRVYQSMQGPFSTDYGVSLEKSAAKPELIWVTGLNAEVVGESGKKRISQEFFCHANLTLDSKNWSAEKHNQLFKNRTSLDSRLFTLIPGRMSIHLPEGFGIPIYSTEKLDLFSMSLNQNVENPNLNIRFRSHIDFIADRAISHPIKAVFARSIYGYVPIRHGKTGTGEELPDVMCALTPMNLHRKIDAGATCAPPLVNASAGGIRKNGETTLHWMVPPGRHVYVTDVTDQLRLNFDTTVHYATAHLHPFGESIFLRNKTTGKTIITLKSKDYSRKKTVAFMEEFTFPEGLPINQNDQYELIITYNNPTEKPTDVMGIVYLYMLDKNFEKSSLPTEFASAAVR